MRAMGRSRVTIYRSELAGEFPKHTQPSENSVAWLAADISAWIDSRPVARLRGRLQPAL